MQPIIHPDVADFINGRGNLQNAVLAYGSPVHVLFPDVAEENARGWTDVLATSGLEKFSIRFAMKACKSKSLCRTFGTLGLGTDISSRQELLNAIECDIPISKLSFTGPEKSTGDIRTCLVQSIETHLDSLSEAKRLVELSGVIGKKTPCFLRYRPATESKSRFGFEKQGLIEAAIFLHESDINVLGLSFHLSGYALETRVSAIEESVEIIDALGASGIRVGALDIGGGFPISYIDAENAQRMQWEDADTWQGKKLTESYPYANDLAGAPFLRELLTSRTKRSRVVGEINQRNLTLILEPGRALLDQCGISLFGVNGSKEVGLNLGISVLDGMSFSACETWFNSDFIPEPLVVGGAGEILNGNGSCKRVVLAGRSCLERDMIRIVETPVERYPENGDIVCYINTAGYQMDMLETQFHAIPIPGKVGATKNGGQWLTFPED